MKVKANFKYNDLLLKRVVEKDEVIEVDEERANVLTTSTYDGKTFCDFVEEEKPNIEESKPKRGRRNLCK
jgi:hypothetical protein